MQRRKFLSFSLASATLGTIRAGGARYARVTSHGKEREFYELRRYQLYNGPQKKICDDYFRDALLPAVNRLGITPVGVFNLTVGPETPAIYVLLPSSSLDTLVTLEVHLAQDSQYLKAGAAFLNAPASEPAFVRMESSLMQAFEKMPSLVLPAATATNGPRVFELRTYESPSDQDHKRKVEMMQSGEEAIFAKAGFSQVFYGDTLIGSHMPNLTYMLSYQSVSERDKLWAAFASAADWKTLSSQSRYAFEAIVSNITNVLLAPAPYSQI
jgi:NIPSNAP